MKIPRLLLSVAAFAAAALAGVAAFQSARLLPDNLDPIYPASLRMAGVTEGSAVIAVSVDTEGRVKDQLVVAYTNPLFARASQEALRNWRFAPATLDGVPVPVQFDLRFDYTLSGAVITAGIVEHFLYDRLAVGGPRGLAYHPVRATLLDQSPVRIGGGAPKYAIAAAKDGISGVVTVRFYIDEQGNVRLPSISGVSNPYLSAQAIDAVRAWKFQPLTSRGQPVLVAAQQQFNFGSGH
jgi:TonB family protein